ncbi:MAG: ice-binding family protein, partial [Nonlabens sp.]|uniref:ice-binding family protein n=1 Tax=Nonlabens sp. TaxID=1888209 RepID=UPI0035A6A31D
SFGQTPNGTVNLGILESFQGYTGDGAISNEAGATWTGDAGTNIGAITGLDGLPSFTGNKYIANPKTLQCREDLFRLYIHLNDLFVDYPATHAAAFGGGETLSPGVYSIPSAGSIGTTLTLDGGNNPNAFFVIKFYGAMTVAAGATVNLTRGTKSSNVFFIAQGAISVAAGANIKGTLFSKIGAVGLGANTVLEGRMLSMQGAIVNGAGAKASPPPDACTIPIFCESSCAPAPAVDVLGVLANYALYTKVGAVPNTSTSGINGNIGSAVGTVSGFEGSVVIGSIIPAANTTQASLDVDSAYNSLMALQNTVTTHPPAFGSVAAGGETINAGVYFINGAGSLLGTLVLDGQNNPNAIFVFKFAGAFTVAAQAKMILINGARRCNVFFVGGAGVATGAISIAAGAVLKGTFLSHDGACGSGADLFLAGRQLSTGGAVNTYSGIIFNNPECITSTSLNPPQTPVIIAVTETTAAINGNTGGSTPALTTNDTLNGNPIVIGTAPGNVILTGVTVPQGLTLNPDGTVTIPPNTPAGEYQLTYKICEVSNPTNCDTVTSTIVVSTPGIALVKSSVISGTGNGLLGEAITYTFTL